MSIYRRAAKRDANEKAITAALEAAGCTIAHLSGKGVPDLLVLRAGRLWLAEVKDGKKAASRRKLTPEQERWHARWWEAGILTFTSVDEAMTWVQSFRRVSSGLSHEAPTLPERWRRMLATSRTDNDEA